MEMRGVPQKPAGSYTGDVTMATKLQWLLIAIPRGHDMNGRKEREG
jgi:hypothetical protein